MHGRVQGGSIGLQGHLHNISLSSMLELINRDRQSCVLYVIYEQQRGVLIIEEGEILEATSYHPGGVRSVQYDDEAVLKMVGWSDVRISLANFRLPLNRSGRVKGSMQELLLNGARLADESRCAA